jgi:hypothetical protein
VWLDLAVEMKKRAGDLKLYATGVQLLQFLYNTKCAARARWFIHGEGIRVAGTFGESIKVIAVAGVAGAAITNELCRVMCNSHGNW